MKLEHNMDETFNEGKKIKYKFRYPGPSSFSESEIATSLFFGREEEKKELFQLILAEDLIVVYAKSGYGKTSLLNAGIYPMLRNKKYAPFPIRFINKDFTPTQTVRGLLLNHYSEPYFIPGKERLANDTDSDLISFLKKFRIIIRSDELKPVLIFDAFEELFTFKHTEEFRETFFKEIAKLVREIKEGNLKYKIVISIREDYLGRIENLSSDIPLIFANRFRLNALNRTNAESAIMKPVEVIFDDDVNISRPFKFTSKAVKRILDELDGSILKEEIKNQKQIWKKGENKTKEIEPLYLQIVCSELEEKLETTKNGVREIKVEDVENMKGIVTDYYNKQFNKLKDKLDKKRISKIQELIEGELISEGRRTPTDFKKVIKRPEIDKMGIDMLIENRLLKVEEFHDTELLEISHDALVEPIEVSAKDRKNKQKRRKIQRKILLSVISALVISSFIIFYLYQMQEKRYKEEILILENNASQKTSDSLRIALQQSTNEKNYLDLTLTSVKHDYEYQLDLNDSLDNIIKRRDSMVLAINSDLPDSLRRNLRKYDKRFKTDTIQKKNK